MTDFQMPPPLKISCTSVDCDNDLHCFKQLNRSPHQKGQCRACGADLVDWNRLHENDIDDAEHTFGALQHERIRHHFFHKAIDQKAMNHALRKGRVKLKAAAEHRLNLYLAPAEPPRDGRQTPLQGNTIFYAQHATATCCRTCLEYWHNIPKGRDLTQEEVEYCTALVHMYLDERLPNLGALPVKVPRGRAQSRTGKLL